MENRMTARLLAMLTLFVVLPWCRPWAAIPVRADEPVIAGDARCPVCGMFVAKYPQWVTQLTLSDGRTLTFDGVKDMMAFVFSPQSFGTAAGVVAGGVRVKDYYSQRWIDGRQAFYVVGSDVYGPMGHELVPFADRSHAETFLKDHKGKEILLFEGITAELVDSLRQGHRMLGHGRKHRE